MKFSKISFTMLFCLFALLSNAQTTYKGVTLDRDPQNVTCFTLRNVNDYPVHVQLEYKIGSKDAEWRDFTGGSYITIPAHEGGGNCVGSKIYALKLTYVDILQPTFGEKVEQFIDAMAPVRNEFKDLKNQQSY